ncbi:hypothetical protein PIB30_083873 [Stylosanthes scabra]|uniref:Uncharacterized protein n=1 Tax=Stylosanthes scabra TaxID=79078 RepID=A0ABU6SSQ7_9FABA|nr:hypothetical protein [Stylosanthes scabra]
MIFFLLKRIKYERWGRGLAKGTKSTRLLQNNAISASPEHLSKKNSITGASPQTLSNIEGLTLVVLLFQY